MDTQKHLFDNKKMAVLLIPLAIDQLLNSFMGTVDTLVVSSLGSAAISAVTLVDSINILIVQAFFALASGGTVVCSHYLGCKRQDHAKEAARQLIFITFCLSALIGIICFLFNGQILGLIFGEVEENVMTNAKQYFFFSAISYPFIALYDDGSCILRAQENSSLPMKISICSNIVNIVLNIWFVWGLHLGVAGSACATLLARMFAMFVVMYKLRKPDLEIPVYDYFTIRPQWKEIRRILNIGIPSGIENSMFQFGKLAIQSTVSTLGTAAIAANAVTNILENLNGVAAQGVGIGLMTIVGQCIGAGRKDEAIYYIKKLSKMAEAAIIISCLVVFALCRPITILGGMEAESARMCFEMTLFITITKPISWVLSFIPAYGMRAAGDVKFSMITSCASMWLCRVSFTIFLCRAYGFGPIAVWIGMFADWTVRGIIFTIRFHSRRWLNHHIID